MGEGRRQIAAIHVGAEDGHLAGTQAEQIGVGGKVEDQGQTQDDGDGGRDGPQKRGAHSPLADDDPQRRAKQDDWQQARVQVGVVARRDEHAGQRRPRKVFSSPVPSSRITLNGLPPRP